MKIVIITNSSSYEPRVDLAAAFFQKKGHQVTRIKSDFVHREKVKRKTKEEGTIYIDTLPYKRNLSFGRLYSHYNFAKKVYKILNRQVYDLIYVFIPANALLKYTAIYKINNPGTKLVTDVIDLWPESLPFRYLKKVWPITLWAALRDDNLWRSDYVILECGLYQSVLKEYLKKVKHSVVYWPKSYSAECLDFVENEKEINICYLGSINNIIDIKFIINLLKELNKQKKTVLHIIGDGENREKFIMQLNASGIPNIYYGSIYDEYAKMKILSTCDYGLNIMKSSVCVGVSMKSVDYMHAGLPIINNIKGDTWDLIESHSLGINCNIKSLSDFAKVIIGRRMDMKEQRSSIRRFYSDVFSEEAYNRRMEECLKEILAVN